MHNGAPEKIRLNGVDCPESGQAFGNRAKQFTGDMVFGKTVTIKGYDKDKYGRTIGDVLLSDGTNLNKELLRHGFAWWYRQYSNDKELEQLEQEARLSKRGLWSDPNPVAPWEWRHNPSTAGNSIPNVSPTDKLATSDTIVYVTNTGSKYHNAGCRYLKSSIPIKLLEASSRYTPCSVCNPPTLQSELGSDRTSSGDNYRAPSYTYPPPVAENGDIRGADNDGDGRAEPVYVRGYYRKDGTYVRGHYRARPRR